MTRSIGLGFMLVLLGACGGVGAPGESSDVRTTEAAGSCDAVRCFAPPQCSAGQHAVFGPGFCCGKCVGNETKLRTGDCACSGGYMSSGYCDQFGAPWVWSGVTNGCVWPNNAQGGLTAETCEAVEAKHTGDGSGSDIYNLGLSCESYGSDCRSTGCAKGQHCDICKTTTGGAYVCLPDGAVC